jgi:hypothetical protein
VECRNILTGELINKYQPTYPFKIIKALHEEILKFSDNTKIPTKFFHQSDNISDLKKSFLVKGTKVLLINNFDVAEFLHVKRYKSETLPNLFVFEKGLQTNLVRMVVDMDYLLEITSVRNYTVIIGLTIKNGFNIQFYSNSDLVMKYSTNFSLYNHFSNYLRLYLTETNNIHTYFINHNLLYNFCKILNEEGLFFVIPNTEFLVLEIKNGKLLTEKIPFDDALKTKAVNCVDFDKFKFAIAFDDNTIKVFSSKDKVQWYNLQGGSLTVVPKSFVNNPTIKGFSQVILTKTSIIGVLGNLIREYNFSISSK